MEIYRNIIPKKNIALALGYFDGVHIGHKKIIQTMILEAKKLNIKTGVITFNDNPANYFSEEKILNIQSFKDKELIIGTLGVDYLFELDFEEFKNLTALEYLEDILIKNFEPKLIVTGYNHTFGKNRQGNPLFLKEHADIYKYKYIKVPELRYNEKEEISSTIIRKRISLGHLNAIKALLNRPFMIRNSVIKGERIAKQLGYPTANLIWPDNIVKLPYGVYFGMATVDNKIIKALISWGNKPTLTNGENEILEVHLYNTKEDLYGKIISVSFMKKLRDEKKFHNIQELKKQLDDDYQNFLNWL